jgi:hypothetical protein
MKQPLNKKAAIILDREIYHFIPIIIMIFVYHYRVFYEMINTASPVIAAL